MALGVFALPAAGAEPDRAFDLPSVCRRMVAEDKWRTETLLGYSVERSYRLKLGDSSQPAEIRVKLEYSYPDRKRFEILSRKNCGYIEDRIFHQALNGEIEAARPDVCARTRILPCNYDFQMLGTADMAGRENYVFRMKPRRKQRFLVDGRAWVDARDAEVTRMDGEVAFSTFWVRSFHMVQTYQRVDGYWMLASIRNNATVRLLGRASMDIENFNYQLRSGPPAGATEESQLQR